MKRIVCFLLVLLTVLTAGCSPAPEQAHTPSKPVETAAPAKPAASVTTAADAEIEEDTAADATSGATPTVPEGMCKACGLDYGDYDGYCYYCHPDFGFTCAECGNFHPAHRTESGLCPDCEAADAITGATPTIQEGLCKTCGEDIGDYDGYCYYCHPDFGFTCTKCGGFYPLHRPASGLCDTCDPSNS